MTFLFADQIHLVVIKIMPEMPSFSLFKHGGKERVVAGVVAVGGEVEPHQSADFVVTHPPPPSQVLPSTPDHTHTTQHPGPSRLPLSHNTDNLEDTPLLVVYIYLPTGTTPPSKRPKILSIIYMCISHHIHTPKHTHTESFPPYGREEKRLGAATAAAPATSPGRAAGARASFAVVLLFYYLERTAQHQQPLLLLPHRHHAALGPTPSTYHGVEDAFGHRDRDKQSTPSVSHLDHGNTNECGTSCCRGTTSNRGTRALRDAQGVQIHLPQDTQGTRLHPSMH